MTNKTIFLMTSIAAVTILAGFSTNDVHADANDTTASIAYCFPGFGCHVDFQDPDGVGSTFSTSTGVLNFPSCPVGIPGVFAGAWSHPQIGDVITATDCLGNESDWDLISETEIVPANQSPDCSASVASTSSLWPPNHKMKDIAILGVTDADGDSVTITVDGITQDEPVNDTGDGDTSPDGSGVGTDTAQVRSERSGTGDGRVYEISFIADDGNGGSCSGSVDVGVPHDKKDTPVDSGQIFDSTS